MKQYKERNLLCIRNNYSENARKAKGITSPRCQLFDSVPVAAEFRMIRRIIMTVGEAPVQEMPDCLFQANRGGMAQRRMNCQLLTLCTHLPQ